METDLDKLIASIGLSAAIDELLHRESISRDEMLNWKQLRQQAEDLIPTDTIDELSQIAEDAFNADN